MPNDSPVTRDAQPKPVPGNAALVGLDKGTKADTRADYDDDGEPPISGNGMVNVHENARR